MKNFQPTSQLVADLEIIAAIMEKHNLDFYVSLDGDTHGLMTVSIPLKSGRCCKVKKVGANELVRSQSL